jgi:hypothetical protein
LIINIPRIYKAGPVKIQNRNFSLFRKKTALDAALDVFLKKGIRRTNYMMEIK